MKFENTGVENLRVELSILDYVMPQHGLIRAEQWDYERVSYDRKFELTDGTYYLRIFGYAVEGDVGAHKAVIQLLAPVLGKHYYPHGVEYGENEDFPYFLIKNCDRILAKLTEDITNLVR